MELFRLNKLYIVESLPNGETMTGELLYQALLSEMAQDAYSGIKDIVCDFRHRCDDEREDWPWGVMVERPVAFASDERKISKYLEL